MERSNSARRAAKERGERRMGLAASMGNGSMEFGCCQGNSTIILSFERETGKWSGWKGLAGIWEFGETVIGRL